MRLFDSHCHLQLSQFDEDRDVVLARMQEQGVGGVVIGTDLETSRAAVALAETRDFLWAAVGLHPNDNPAEAFDADAYRALAEHPKVVGIGECGLDYFRGTPAPEVVAAQKARLASHVTLAVAVQKPLIIHCRDAHEDMLELLAQYRAQRGEALKVLIHFFTGTKELAEKYLALGCSLSFPGPITYTDMYDASIVATPLERMLIETDAPFAAPVPNRGKRNEPVFVADVAAKIAVLRGVSVEEIAAQTLQNARTFFKLQH